MLRWRYTAVLMWLLMYAHLQRLLFEWKWWKLLPLLCDHLFQREFFFLAPRRGRLLRWLGRLRWLRWPRRLGLWGLCGFLGLPPSRDSRSL